jgi:hypothetical protein
MILLFKVEIDKKQLSIAVNLGNNSLTKVSH